ncbi:glucose 1-dehydrogenase [Mycolicibacterium insubricum]|uniref:3-oxoacyl-[acyl-carrier-protein] reductase MabA n=1 Tax=Mycolicibacterium insubricum TaxID=444597 RepID=A0A1X0D4M2_9MYCO|nr:SDR family NAD(P)-dependent oxidoreductase [Mycolicibacterium insubricum]MCV7083363.1 SDR family oxidoreductase [Mycolicibacterium insubricum]ORA67351.1 oxidoreductase [Mycolicibacterium insubricum]BBZ68134.1 glucose 1-dehydrogenase [Mycolicibacterium insubricum]
MTLNLDLSGRTALITGSGQGVGHGLARTFAEAGAAVLVNDLRVQRAEEAAAEIRADGGKARALPFDVTDFAAVTAALADAGPVDILVNNAGNAGPEGFGSRGRFADSDPGQWEPFLRVNLYGVLYCTRAVLPAMEERRWGRVLTIISDAGRTGDAYGAAYGVSKAGAAGLTRSIALESGRYGVTANNISLGTMRTPMTEPVWADPDSPQAKAILSAYAIRRPGTADDLAALAVVLAGEQGSWITGQTIPVNGGYSFAL